jgi:hypothetical protein
MARLRPEERSRRPDLRVPPESMKGGLKFLRVPEDFDHPKMSCRPVRIGARWTGLDPHLSEALMPAMDEARDRLRIEESPSSWVSVSRSALRPSSTPQTCCPLRGLRLPLLQQSTDRSGARHRPPEIDRHADQRDSPHPVRRQRRGAVRILEDHRAVSMLVWTRFAVC